MTAPSDDDIKKSLNEEDYKSYLKLNELSKKLEKTPLKVSMTSDRSLHVTSLWDEFHIHYVDDNYILTAWDDFLGEYDKDHEKYNNIDKLYDDIIKIAKEDVERAVKETQYKIDLLEKEKNGYVNKLKKWYDMK